MAVVVQVELSRTSSDVRAEAKEVAMKDAED